MHSVQERIIITLGTYLTWGMWDSSRTKDNFLLLFFMGKEAVGSKCLWRDGENSLGGLLLPYSCELIQNSYVSTIYPFKSTGCSWGFAVSVVRFPSFCTLVEEKWKEGYGWVVIFNSLRIKQVLHNALSIFTARCLCTRTAIMSLASSCTVTKFCSVEALCYCSVCCAYTECLTNFWGAGL